MSTLLSGDLGGTSSVVISSGALFFRHRLGNRLGLYAVVSRGISIATPVGHEAFDRGIGLTRLFESATNPSLPRAPNPQHPPRRGRGGRQRGPAHLAWPWNQ